MHEHKAVPKSQQPPAVDPNNTPCSNCLPLQQEELLQLLTSSMKMTLGARSCAMANSCLTSRSLSPCHLEIRALEDTLKNVAPASPATACNATMFCVQEIHKAKHGFTRSKDCNAMQCNTMQQPFCGGIQLIAGTS